MKKTILKFSSLLFICSISMMSCKKNATDDFDPNEASNVFTINDENTIANESENAVSAADFGLSESIDGARTESPNLPIGFIRYSDKFVNGKNVYTYYYDSTVVFKGGFRRKGTVTVSLTTTGTK